MAKRYNTIAEFLPTEDGDLFVLRFAPVESPRGSVVFVPPFAEEMNRCRHMISRQARRLAERGVTAIVFDLFGTGDSGGSFGDASWPAWQRNLAQIVDYARRHSAAPVWLLGVRLGALLALDVLGARRCSIDGLLMWNPIVSGSTYMNQFLRLRLIASMMDTERPKETLKDLHAMLEADGALEVAGYRVTKGLLDSVSPLSLRELMAGAPRIRWMELAAAEGQSLPLPVTKAAQHAADRGMDFSLYTVHGPQFWATQELAVAPSLLDATCEELEKCL